VRETERGRGPGVLIYWEAAGALPRRGVCCPATLGGERGQERDDNTRSGRCAIGSMLTGRGCWRSIMRGDGRMARGGDA
jgi:hypothetical protein